MKILIRAKKKSNDSPNFVEGGMVVRDGVQWRLADNDLVADYVKVINVRPVVALAKIMATKARKVAIGTGMTKPAAELHMMKQLLDMANVADKLREHDILKPRDDGGFDVIKRGECI